MIFRHSKTASQNEQKKMLFNNKKQEPELKFNPRLPVAFKGVGPEDLIFQECSFLRNMPYYLSGFTIRGIASFSTIVGLADFHFHTSWKLHPWPIIHTDLTNTWALTPATHNLLQEIEWGNQKLVRPGLQVYGLATPLSIYDKIHFPAHLSSH